jgi:hypothetical protein
MPTRRATRPARDRRPTGPDLRWVRGGPTGRRGGPRGRHRPRTCSWGWWSASTALRAYPPFPRCDESRCSERS